MIMNTLINCIDNKGSPVQVWFTGKVNGKQFDRMCQYEIPAYEAWMTLPSGQYKVWLPVFDEWWK